MHTSSRQRAQSLSLQRLLRSAKFYFSAKFMLLLVGGILLQRVAIGQVVVANIPLVDEPLSVTAPSLSQRIYLPNSNYGVGKGTVSVISTVTDTEIAKITVGADPIGIVVSPDMTHVYVTNAFDNTVSVIATNTESVVATVPVGIAPGRPTLTPDGSSLYVLNGDSVSSADQFNVSVVDTASLGVVATIPLPGEAYSALMNATGSLVYVMTPPTITIISTATESVVGSIALPLGNMSQMVMSPDGAYIYAENEGYYPYQTPGTLLIIDTQADVVAAAINVGSIPIGVAVTPDGSSVYVPNYGDGTVSVVDTSSRQVVATINVGPQPVGATVTPDGSSVYIPNNGCGFQSIDTATNRVTVASEDCIGPPVFTSDGQYGYTYSGTQIASRKTSLLTTTTTILSSSNPTSVAAPETFTVAVAGGKQPTGYVSLYVWDADAWSAVCIVTIGGGSSNPSCTATTAGLVYQTTYTSSGGSILMAVYSGDSSNLASSNTLHVEIDPPNAANKLFRTYLSANGNDMNACTLGAPCRLLPAALAATEDGGEIWILDSANYNIGTVTVNQSVSILAVPGALGSVIADGSDAVDIVTSSHPISVMFRNIAFREIDGNYASNGIAISNSSAKTVIDHAKFSNFRIGVYGSQFGTTDISHSSFNGTPGGTYFSSQIDFQGQGAMNPSMVTIDHCDIRQASVGVEVSNAEVTLTQNIISNNAIGISGYNDAFLLLDGNVVVGNQYGLISAYEIVDNVFFSMGNNTIVNNGLNLEATLATLVHQ